MKRIIAIALFLLLSGCSIKIGTVMINDDGEPHSKSDIQEETTVTPDTQVSGIPGI